MTNIYRGEGDSLPLAQKGPGRLILVWAAIFGLLQWATAQACDPNGYECLDQNQCNQCYDNFYVDDHSTGSSCPDDHFYSESIQRCIDGEGSCSGLCAYRSECFQCPLGQLLVLETMKGVSEGDSVNHFLFEDDQFTIPRFGRTLEYFVDPSSKSSVELGTQAYPYKHINSAFIELLNIHSYSNRKVIIKLKESTIHYLEQGKSFVLGLNECK